MNSSPNPYLVAFGKNHGWFFIWGLLLLLLGVIAISATAFTTIISVLFLGFLILMGGIVIIIDAFTFWWHKWSGLFFHFILGILYVVTGILLINSPVLASISLTLFLGIFYLLLGAFRLIYSISIRTPRWGWNLFNAIISLLLGALILSSWPGSSLYIIGLFIGIDLIISGWTYIMASIAARALKRG